MAAKRFVLRWERADDSRTPWGQFFSQRLQELMASPHGMWNYMTYRDAIQILGWEPGEIYREGRIDLDPREWADFGWMTCYAGPPESAVRAMREAVTAANVNPYSPDLMEPLREAAARLKFQRPRGPDFEVIGTEGAQAAIAYTLMAVLNPGDEVIISDPGYFHFTAAILMAGGVSVAIPLGPQNGYRLDPQELAAHIGPRTRVLLLCDPLNPFGTVQTKEELIAIAELTHRHNLLVIDDITHNTHRVDPEARHYPLPALAGEAPVDHVLTTFSLSHGYGMAGVRLGFLGGHPELLRACLLVKVALTRLNTNLVSQYGALAALQDEEFVRQSEAVIRRNYGFLREVILPENPGLVLPVEPQYGFSLVLDVSGAGVSAQELTVALFKRRVAVYPGDGLGDVGATEFIRLNISRPDMWAMEQLRSALPEAIAEARSGLYREAVLAFFEKRPTERARRIAAQLRGEAP